MTKYKKKVPVYEFAQLLKATLNPNSTLWNLLNPYISYKVTKHNITNNAQFLTSLQTHNFLIYIFFYRNERIVKKTCGCCMCASFNRR